MPETAEGTPAEAYSRLLERAAELTENLQRHPNPAVREDVTELLQAVDHMHRAAIHRLAILMAENGAAEFIEKAAADPLVCTLLQLYDVLPLPEIVALEEAIEAARPALAEHHANIEVLYAGQGLPVLRLAGSFPLAQEVELRGIVERAIVAASGQTRSVRWQAAERPVQPGSFVALGDVKPAKKQTWVDLCDAETFPLGIIRRFDVRGLDIAVGRSGSGFFAFPNACPGTALPLHLGRISDDELICPWHGCRWDTRTGRGAPETKRLEPMTLRVMDGRVAIAIWEPR